MNNSDRPGVDEIEVAVGNGDGLIDGTSALELQNAQIDQ